MKKVIDLTLIAILFAFAGRAIDPITSSEPVFCTGSSGLVVDSTAGGTWSSSNTSVATVGGASMSSLLTPVTEGVQNIMANDATINIYPNPASGSLNITWNARTADNAIITICDVAGHEVFAQPMNMTSGAGTQKVDISALTDGLYFVSVRSPTTSYINKLNVAH